MFQERGGGGVRAGLDIVVSLQDPLTCWCDTCVAEFG